MNSFCEQLDLLKISCYDAIRQYVTRHGESKKTIRNDNIYVEIPKEYDLSFTLESNFSGIFIIGIQAIYVDYLNDDIHFIGTDNNDYYIENCVSIEDLCKISDKIIEKC